MRMVFEVQNRCKECGCWLDTNYDGLYSCPIGKWSANSELLKGSELMELDNKEETN